MPWLPLYLFGDDFDILLKILNDDPETAFIVSTGERQWKAVKSLPAFVGNRFTIWHVPSGPLPLVAANAGDPNGEVIDPWQGWTERRSCADPTQPFFGSSATGIVWFNVRRGDDRTVGLSSFEWIGNHYSVIGISAEKVTERWWKRLRATVKRLSCRVPRGEPHHSSKPAIYAFAAAIRAFEEGKRAAVNP